MIKLRCVKTVSSPLGLFTLGLGNRVPNADYKKDMDMHTAGLRATWCHLGFFLPRYLYRRSREPLVVWRCSVPRWRRRHGHILEGRDLTSDKTHFHNLHFGFNQSFVRHRSKVAVLNALRNLVSSPPDRVLAEWSTPLSE